MSTLTFFTPVTLEEPFIFTMGASVKTGTNPIGMFGTGLKYAIAVTLRDKGSIKIETNKHRYEFVPFVEKLRAQEITFIRCDIFDKNTGDQVAVKQLPMTTEYGKNWEPWMVMRELYSNTVDEGGEVYDYDWNGGRDANLMPQPLPAEYTRIVVDCPAIYDAWQTRHRYLIDTNRRPIWQGTFFSMYPGSNDAGFYRGIRTTKLESSSTYTYNVLINTTLTEDRTLDACTFQSRIRYGIKDCKDKDVIRAFLSAVCTQGTWENKFDWDYVSLSSYEQEFREIACEMYRERISECSDSFRRMIGTYLKDEDPISIFKVCEISHEHTEKYNICKGVLAAAGMHFKDVRIVFSRDIDVMGICSPKHRAIFIHPERNFDRDDWKDQGCMTLIEEYVHLMNGSDDCTRAMQHDYNTLIYKLITTGV